MVLQDKYSVQFDDLFKIAWEEDDANIVSHEDDGEQLAGDEGTNGNLLPPYFICSSHMNIFSCFESQQLLSTPTDMPF